MENQVLQFLRTPGELDTLNLLEEGNGRKVERRLIGTRSRKEFPVYEGIPVLLNNSKLKANHGCFRFRRGGEPEIRTELLGELEIKETDKVLQVSMGTGEDLGHLLKQGQYFIVDISMVKRKMCNKRNKNDSSNAVVVMGDAGNLPFAGDVFDSVFSWCTFRFINDKSKAVQEMVRVAKPGAKILIIDQRKAGVPLELVPPGMKQVQAKELPAWDLFCLTFYKPKTKRFGKIRLPIL